MMESFMSLGPTATIALGVIFAVLLLWALIIKGYALWTAARRGDKVWFIVLLVVNTVGILELVYIFAIAKVRWSSSSENPPTNQ